MTVMRGARTCTPLGLLYTTSEMIFRMRRRSFCARIAAAAPPACLPLPGRVGLATGRSVGAVADVASDGAVDASDRSGGLPPVKDEPHDAADRSSPGESAVNSPDRPRASGLPSLIWKRKRDTTRNAEITHRFGHCTRLNTAAAPDQATDRHTRCVEGTIALRATTPEKCARDSSLTTSPPSS